MIDRSRLKPVLLALLCVVAVGVAAATLTNPDVTGPSGGDGTGGPSLGPPVNDSGGGLVNSRNATNTSAGGISLPRLCFPALLDPAFYVLVGALFVAAFAGIRWKEDAMTAVAILLVVSIPVALAVLVFTSGCRVSPLERFAAQMGGGFGNPGAFGTGGGQGGTGSGDTGVSFVSLSLFLVLALAIAGAFAMLFLGDETEADEADDVDDEVAERDTDVAAVGRVAGDAADRIENEADVENEVFRAWAEMTTHVDVAHPDASTPREFAAAAVDAGMSPDDVNELTELFEEVRYGGESPTETRETRALDALRRIERAYATEGDDE